MSFGRRAVYVAPSPLLPLVLVPRKARDVFAKGRNRAAFLRALPAMTLLLVWWAAGELVGYLTASPERR